MYNQPLCAIAAAALAAFVACSPPAPAPAPTADGGPDAGAGDGPGERRCGQPNTYFAAYTTADLAKLSGCTILVGQFQEDSVVELENLDGLQSVHEVQGNINLFRSGGFTSLHGLENLERIEGSLWIHLCNNLTTLSALSRLRAITGNLWIQSNNKLPLADAQAFAASVTVGGQTRVEP